MWTCLIRIGWPTICASFGNCEPLKDQINVNKSARRSSPQAKHTSRYHSRHLHCVFTSQAPLFIMGRLAEMQRKLLEVYRLSMSVFFLTSLTSGVQQMMGPEAMGVANANLTWSDEKVCRNFCCVLKLSSLEPQNSMVSLACTDQGSLLIIEEQ